MKESKLFDRIELLLAIICLASFATGIVLFVIMIFTATVNYTESGAIDTLTYNSTLMAIYSCINLVSFIALTWFLIRLATYKLRKKEEDVLN